MNFGHLSKNRKALIVISSAFLAAGIFVSLYSPVIFQEGNPWPQIKGIAKLNFGDSNMVKLSGSDNKYMTNSKNCQEVIKSFMKDRDYEFTEQMGSGYFFRSPTGENAVAVHRYYSRYYSLWKISENSNTDRGARFQYLEDLLSQITDFDSCVAAGFSIMKSNPPQCATSDGRSFVQGN